MRYLGEMREGENVNDIYLCKSKQILKTKAGKTYYSVMLQDQSGSMDAKVWDLTNAIGHFEALDYIAIVGQVTSFQGNLQLNIQRVRKAQEGEYNPSDYMPVSKRNIDEMYKELTDFIPTVKNEYLNKLLCMYFVENKEFINNFKKHSAAKAVHHSFMGGLLEHTLGVTKMCNYMASYYPVLNRDLLITAAMFHDIGKLSEISAFPENDYTDDGQLLGHIFIGAEMIGNSIKSIPGFPKKLESELRHCILAHHGELEFGSPKKPAIVEAVALNFADNTDAKMETFTEILDSSDGKTEWLGFNRYFDSNVRRTVGK
ncbi:MAG: HD domain-containing protein [Lachnospiraceae bacterium]|nr:HD domain-containing protein [Lachnospiraceae bacterium]